MHGESPNGLCREMPNCVYGSSDVIVVGIAGATNAGKTTVARRLLEEFPGSVAVHQDEFFRSIDDPAHEHVDEINHHNWDTISAVKFDLMLQSVQEQFSALKQTPHSPGPCSRPRLLILEGILVLNVDKLARLIDRKYLITLTKEECRRRRLTRNYDPVDVPGYFDLIVWPMYEKFLAELENADDIRYFSGKDASENTVQAITSDLLQFHVDGCDLKNGPVPTKYSTAINGHGNPSGDAPVPVLG